MKELLNNLKGEVFWKEPLSKHTSLRVGGPVDAYVTPRDVEDLACVFGKISRQKIPYIILGDGSNLLISDRGFRGVAFNLCNLSQIKILDSLEDPPIESGGDNLSGDDNLGMTSQNDFVDVFIGAGLRKQKLLSWAMARGFSGAEFLSGVPGQVGGGLFMNAGTHAGSFSDVTRKIQMVTSKGEEIWVAVGLADFSYRAQRFCKGNIITGAIIRLGFGKKSEIKARVQQMVQERKDRQPLKLPNCGSTFTNPPGHTAGKLIEEAGLKGYRVGQAMVSQKHANFIINLGGATASDILSIIHVVEDRVKQHHGIELKREVIVVG